MEKSKREAMVASITSRVARKGLGLLGSRVGMCDMLVMCMRHNDITLTS